MDHFEETGVNKITQIMSSNMKETAELHLFHSAVSCWQIVKYSSV